MLGQSKSSGVYWSNCSTVTRFCFDVDDPGLRPERVDSVENSVVRNARPVQKKSVAGVVQFADDTETVARR